MVRSRTAVAARTTSTATCAEHLQLVANLTHPGPHETPADQPSRRCRPDDQFRYVEPTDRAGNTRDKWTPMVSSSRQHSGNH